VVIFANIIYNCI